MLCKVCPISIYDRNEEFLLDFVSIFHHEDEVGIVVYRGTDTSVVVHEFVTSNLEE